MRIHENNYEYVWESLPAIFPAFLAVLREATFCLRRRKKSQETMEKLKFRINSPVAKTDTAASLANEQLLTFLDEGAQTKKRRRAPTNVQMP